MSANPREANLSIVHHTPSQVAGRLHELDPALTEALLLEAVQFALGYYAECTAHDPSSAAGYLLWGKTIRSLRDLLVPAEWKSATRQNYPTIEHPSGAFAISVAGSDGGTGIIDGNPTTRTEKGTVTKGAIAQNQASLWDYKPNLAPLRKRTWLLLIHVDLVNDEVRAELSLPVGTDEDNRVSWWRERIILTGFPYEPTFVHSTFDGGDDEDDAVDIQVLRRNS